MGEVMTMTMTAVCDDGARGREGGGTVHGGERDSSSSPRRAPGCFRAGMRGMRSGVCIYYGEELQQAASTRERGLWVHACCSMDRWSGLVGCV